MGFSLELAIEIIENGESTAKISLNILIQHTNISEYEHYVGILKYSKKKSSLILYGVCIEQKTRPCSLLSIISYFIFQQILVTVVLIWYSECRYGATSTVQADYKRSFGPRAVAVDDNNLYFW